LIEERLASSGGTAEGGCPHMGADSSM